MQNAVDKFSFLYCYGTVKDEETEFLYLQGKVDLWGRIKMYQYPIERVTKGRSNTQDGSRMTGLEKSSSVNILAKCNYQESKSFEFVIGVLSGLVEMMKERRDRCLRESGHSLKRVVIV